MEKIVRLAKQSLKQALGAKELFAVGYGDVGSSIYYALGATALFALGATPLALMLAGLVFICTALTYAELSSTFPEPGGAAAFSRHAFNDLISFIAGWGLLLDYIVTLAISAFTITPYFNAFLAPLHLEIPNTDLAHNIATIVIIASLFAINFIGIRLSGWISFLLAAFTLLTQVGIVLIGAFFLLNLPYVWEHLEINTGAAWSPDWANFLKGTAMAMVAYTGIEAIAQLSAETKNPEKAVPRSIKWTVAVVLFLYLGVSTVGLSVISPHDLGTRYLENPIAGIAENFPIGGEYFGPAIGLIAAIILLIAANAGLIGCSRLAFSMGEFYQVPVTFFKLHARFRTPYVSLSIFALLAILVILISQNQMLYLADLYNFGAQIAFFSAHLSLVILRIKQPTLARPYRAPLNIPLGKSRSVPLTALLGVVATFSVWLLVVATKPAGRLVGFIWLGLGLTMYFLYRKRKHIAPFSSLSVEEIAIPEYRPLHYKNILVSTRYKEGTEALQTAFQLARDHGAQATVLYILEVPDTLPIDGRMDEREALGRLALKRAEAVAREYHLTIRVEFLRARSLETSLVTYALNHHHDLIVAGVDKREQKRPSSVSAQMQNLLKNSPCPVILCRS